MSLSDTGKLPGSADDVGRAFAFAQRTYSGTPCQECKGRSTVGTIYQGVVSASCEDCGGATRIGPLARVVPPQSTAQGGRGRPVLRAPADAPRGAVNGIRRPRQF
ncbi:MAG: hypothetical protein HOY79_07545 [Streptomyces sp.]|nr:hypothetical protein [Streptomyces sp.]